MTLLNFRAGNHPQQTAIRGADDAVDDRATHPLHFDPLNEEYGPFTLDVAAAEHNAKCERYYDRTINGLTMSWAGERVWCNPPYSDIAPWVRKAWAEMENPLCAARWPNSGGACRTSRLNHERSDGRPTRNGDGWGHNWDPPIIVMLLPANRTEQKWWQQLVEPHRDRPGSALTARFLPGRMRFIKAGALDVGPNERPPFGCCLLIWRPSL